MYYLIIFFILLAFASLECLNINRTSQTILLIIGASITCLTAGLRYETGGDWDIYSTIFNEIHTSPISFGRVADLEIGYLTINIIVKCLGGSLQTVYFIISIVNTILLLICLEVYIPRRKLLGLLIYYSIFFFALDMIYTRQSTSLLICLYAVQYIKRRKLAKYIALIAVAYLFHRMALLMLPVYFIADKHISNKIAMIVTAIGMVIMGTNTDWFIPLYLKVSSMLGDVYYEKALYYISNEQFAVARTISIGFFLNAFLLVIFIWRRKDIEKNKYGNTFFNLYIASLAIYYYFYELIEVSMRIRFYFFIAIVFLFPMIVENAKSIINRIMLMILLYAYSLAYNRHIMFEQPAGAAYNPYQNYLIYKITGKKSTGTERLNKSISITKEERAENNKEQDE
ncbi:MAG: EpsG family protein [Paludibacteraceae bacterium]|nr:EpsG family protein [Paludibacteraceae bacterium]